MQAAVSGGDADDAKAKADEELRQEAVAAATKKAETEAKAKAEADAASAAAADALTEEEVKRAKEVFRNACANGGNESSELDKEAFIECIKELVSSANKRASSDDADSLSMPNEQDLNAAFDTADADKSGLVDEGEFIELYGKVKAGKVEGLGGGFFSNAFAFSMFRTPLMQAAVSGGDADDAKAKADEEARMKAEKAIAAHKEELEAHKEARSKAEEQLAMFKMKAKAEEEARIRAENEAALHKAKAEEEALKAKALLKAKYAPPPPPPLESRPVPPEPVQPPPYSRQTHIKETKGPLSFFFDCS